METDTILLLLLWVRVVAFFFLFGSVFGGGYGKATKPINLVSLAVIMVANTATALTTTNIAAKGANWLLVFVFALAFLVTLTNKPLHGE